jgi:hypothetical protein
MPRYADSLTIRDARDQYFMQSGFDEGSYSDKWVKLQAGPFPLYFPNTAARVRAVRFHDLHHVATEYETTWTGEAEIGAWEIASGCADHYAARKRFYHQQLVIYVNDCLWPFRFRHQLCMTTSPS